jgi:hypothetical protein
MMTKTGKFYQGEIRDGRVVFHLLHALIFDTLFVVTVKIIQRILTLLHHTEKFI